MAQPPVPAPRTRLLKQMEVCADDMDKNPPPVPPKTCKPYQSGCQPLRVNVRSCSLPESDQQSAKGDFPVQTHQFRQGAFPKPYERTHSVPTPMYSQCHQDSQDNEHCMEGSRSEEPWKEPKTSGTEIDDVKTFTQQAENLRKVINEYYFLLTEHGANLQGHIMELEEVADGVDKVHKGVKIAGITGGAAGALGVAAAVGGVILAPVTLGASLAVTAVGVGVAAAGGVTGASAAITNKVHSNMDRKKVETILKDHCTVIEEIESCVKVINTNIEFLKKYEMSSLKGMDWNAVRMVKMAKKVGDKVGATGTLSKSTGLIQGFTLGLDMYFNKEDSKKLKKGSEAKFAKQIRKVAKQMQTSLDELMKFKSVMEAEDM